MAAKKAGFNEIWAALQKGHYDPVYILHGEEPYFIDKISDYIEANALSEADKGFNQVVMYGKDATVQTVMANARRFPMMSDRQVVIIKEAQEIADLKKEEAEKLLIDYIKNPLPSTILVFCHKHKTLDGRKAFGKVAAEYATVLLSEKIREYKVGEWVSEYVRSKGHSIGMKATQMLADYIGADLSRLANEIDKMLINFQGKVEVNEAMIQQYVGISKDYNVFELQKALGERNLSKAMDIVKYFEANPKKNPPIPTVALIFSFFSKLVVVHGTRDKSEKGIAAALKLNPYFVKDYLLAARNYSLAHLEQIIHNIKVADLQLKGVEVNGAGPDAVVRDLVLKIMHARPAAA
jgi:DNA polymerase III subunit delta